MQGNEENKKDFGHPVQKSELEPSGGTMIITIIWGKQLESTEMT